MSFGERRRLAGRGAPPVPVVNPVPLPTSFYSRPAREVARALLGKVIASTTGDTRCAARIVETEAYTGPEDDASHAAARIGRTLRNRAMFGQPGIAYVYRIYGVHWCLNVVTDALDHPAAVLIRAAEPLDGLETLRARRPGRPDRDLLRGPGNLCAGLGITGEQDHHPLDRSPLVVLDGDPVMDDSIETGGRIGVSRAADLPLRFWIRGNTWVSGYTSTPITRPSNPQ